MPMQRISLKDIDPNKYDFNVQQPQQRTQQNIPARSGPQQEEGIVNNIIGGAKNLLASAATAPVALAELPGQLVNLATGHKPTEEAASQRLYKSLGGTEAGNMFTKALNYTAGNWPLLLLGGPITGGKVAADFASSLGMTAAEEAGLGTLGQLAGSVLGAKGFRHASHALESASKSAAKNPKKYNEFISSWYDKTENLGGKIPEKAEKLNNGLNKLHEKVKREYVNPGKFDEAARSRVLANIKTVENNLTKPQITAADIFNEKKALNKAYAWKDSTEGKYYSELRKLFTDELEDISKRHPEFGTAYKTADELYQLRNGQSNLAQWLEKNTSTGILGEIVTNPIAQGALGILAGLQHGTPYGIAAAAAPKVGMATLKGADTLIKETKFLNKVFQSEGGKKLLMDIVADSAKANSVKLASNLKKLNQYANEFEKGNSKTNLKKIPLKSIDLNKYNFNI